MGKKCQVFGNFLTVKCQFSGGSGPNITKCSDVFTFVHRRVLPPNRKGCEFCEYLNTRDLDVTRYYHRLSQWVGVCSSPIDIWSPYRYLLNEWVADPPENCHLTVKKLQKTWHFFKKNCQKFSFFSKILPFDCQKIAKNLTFFSTNFLKKKSIFVNFFEKNVKFLAIFASQMVMCPEGQIITWLTWSTETYQTPMKTTQISNGYSEELQPIPKIGEAAMCY